MHPDDDSSAKASVRTPPSNKVMDDRFPHPVVVLDAGTATAPNPMSMFSSRLPTHSPVPRLSLFKLGLLQVVSRSSIVIDSTCSTGARADGRAKGGRHVNTKTNYSSAHRMRCFRLTQHDKGNTLSSHPAFGKRVVKIGDLRRRRATENVAPKVAEATTDVK